MTLLFDKPSCYSSCMSWLKDCRYLVLRRYLAMLYDLLVWERAILQFWLRNGITKTYCITAAYLTAVGYYCGQFTSLILSPEIVTSQFTREIADVVHLTLEITISQLIVWFIFQFTINFVITLSSFIHVYYRQWRKLIKYIYLSTVLTV